VHQRAGRSGKPVLTLHPGDDRHKPEFRCDAQPLAARAQQHSDWGMSAFIAVTSGGQPVTQRLDERRQPWQLDSLRFRH
jgi:hypothetical protein